MRKRQEDRDLTGADGVLLPWYRVATLGSGSRERPEAERGVIFLLPGRGVFRPFRLNSLKT